MTRRDIREYSGDEVDDRDDRRCLECDVPILYVGRGRGSRYCAECRQAREEDAR